MEEIRKITTDDAEFPQSLKKIPQPPKVLYFKGELPQDNELCFGIVGARRCSDYGKQAALEFAGNLADAGITVVSGLAPGIDTFAHRAVMERNKRTIAILGTGIDEKSIYPKSNIPLARKIIEAGGCVISEYPPGTAGTHFTFPQRNRIISGLSLGILVIEAKQRSGALITADWAKKQGKKVFALPGSIFSSNSKGPHQLIKNGAKLMENVNDILNELKIPGLISKNSEIAGDTEEENLILNSLKEGGLEIDKIIEKTKLPAAKVASLLSLLEIKDRVRNLGGNIYALKR